MSLEAEGDLRDDRDPVAREPGVDVHGASLPARPAARSPPAPCYKPAVPEPTLATMVALALVAAAAGLIDAIAGGGGLLTVPALLSAGLPPHLALGTNKGQSVFGSGAAMLRFARGGLIDPARARVGFPLGLLGSAGGAALVLAVPAGGAQADGAGACWAPPPSSSACAAAGRRRAPRRACRRAGTAAPGPPALVALVIGAYDGFFGPGTGTFLIVAFVALLGDDLARASADAKVVNFASNLAALALFAWRGVVVWPVALPMAAGQLGGAWLGAHLAVRTRRPAGPRGSRWRSALALAAKLAWDLRG